MLTLFSDQTKDMQISHLDLRLYKDRKPSKAIIILHATSCTFTIMNEENIANSIIMKPEAIK